MKHRCSRKAAWTGGVKNEITMVKLVVFGKAYRLRKMMRGPAQTPIVRRSLRIRTHFRHNSPDVGRIRTKIWGRAAGIGGDSVDFFGNFFLPFMGEVPKLFLAKTADFASGKFSHFPQEPRTSEGPAPLHLSASFPPLRLPASSKIIISRLPPASPHDPRNVASNLCNRR